MTRGQRFKPSTADDGAWFRHRGEPQDMEGKLRAKTSTSDMLKAPFSASAAEKPRPPPTAFGSKSEVAYTTSNRFTDHDNRHHFQSCGEYFGDGKTTRSLGRRLMPPDRRLHHTDHHFLRHNSRQAIDFDYNPVTATSYRGKQTEELPVHRRFPRRYTMPEGGALPGLTTSTSCWFGDQSHKTPMHVLAVSQEPFLGHNRWKYSNHGLNRVYPPYNRKRSPEVPNVINRYGPDFKTFV